MAVNKVEYGDETIVDMTDATATENDIIEGATAYIANGTKATGKAKIPRKAEEIEFYGTPYLSSLNVQDAIMELNQKNFDDFNKITGGLVMEETDTLKPQVIVSERPSVDGKEAIVSVVNPRQVIELDSIEDWEALPESKYTDNKIYKIKGTGQSIVIEANDVKYKNTNVANVLDKLTDEDEWISINGISFIKKGNVVTVKSDGYPLTPTTTRTVVYVLPEKYRPTKNIYAVGYCGGYRAKNMSVDIMINGEVAIMADSNQSYGGFIVTYLV